MSMEVRLVYYLLTFQQCLKCFATLHKQHRNFFQLHLFLSDKMCWWREFRKHESETVIFGFAWEFNYTKIKLAINLDIIIKGNITLKYLMTALIFPKNPRQYASFSIYVAILLLGTLSKPRRRLQRGHGKTKDLIGRTIAQHVCFKLCTLLSRPMQNNRDLKQTTTATATRTWKNKRSNWQNNSSTRAF